MQSTGKCLKWNNLRYLQLTQCLALRFTKQISVTRISFACILEKGEFENAKMVEWWGASHNIKDATLIKKMLLYDT